jgi:GMP synthase (glutamine-hydrolysing)
MKSLYILKLGSSYPHTVERLGDFDHWLMQGLGAIEAPVVVLDVPSITDLPASLPTAEACAGVIISGSHAMVTERLPWSVALECWIPSMVLGQVPLLGVCYGHQLLAQSMGGEVHYHPQGREIGSVPIRLTAEAADDPLFRELPAAFRVQATHAQSVHRLPPGAVLLAGNDYEPHHAFRLGRSAWGLQFHPEYSPAIMCAYIEAQDARLRAAGQDIERLLREVEPTPVAAQLLLRFAGLVVRCPCS